MQVQKENIDVLEPDAWHLFVTASSSMQSFWAACRPSWGIIAGMMLWNCAAPTESYFPLSVLLHWRSISSIWRFTGALSTSVNGLLNSSNLNFWAAKEENRCVNSIPSAPRESGGNISYQCLATQKVTKVSLLHLSLPQGQLCLESSHCIIIVCDHTSSSLKLFIMSHKNSRSHCRFLSWSSVVSFPFLSRNWQISSCNSKNLLSTFAWFSRRTSVRAQCHVQLTSDLRWTIKWGEGGKWAYRTGHTRCCSAFWGLLCQRYVSYIPTGQIWWTNKNVDVNTRLRAKPS